MQNRLNDIHFVCFIIFSSIVLFVLYGWMNIPILIYLKSLVFFFLVSSFLLVMFKLCCVNRWVFRYVYPLVPAGIYVAFIPALIYISNPYQESMTDIQLAFLGDSMFHTIVLLVLVIVGYCFAFLFRRR